MHQFHQPHLISCEIQCCCQAAGPETVSPRENMGLWLCSGWAVVNDGFCPSMWMLEILMRGCVSGLERGLGAEVWCSLVPYDCEQDIHYSFLTLLTKSWTAFQYSPRAILQPMLSDWGAVLYGFHSPPLLSSHPNPLTSAFVKGTDGVFSTRGWLGVWGRGKTQRLFCLVLVKFFLNFLIVW